jgi:hypothetical protein
VEDDEEEEDHDDVEHIVVLLDYLAGILPVDSPSRRLINGSSVLKACWVYMRRLSDYAFEHADENAPDEGWPYGTEMDITRSVIPLVVARPTYTRFTAVCISDEQDVYVMYDGVEKHMLQRDTVAALLIDIFRHDITMLGMMDGDLIDAIGLVLPLDASPDDDTLAKLKACPYVFSCLDKWSVITTNGVRYDVWEPLMSFCGDEVDETTLHVVVQRDEMVINIDEDARFYTHLRSDTVTTMFSFDEEMRLWALVRRMEDAVERGVSPKEHASVVAEVDRVRRALRVAAASYLRHDAMEAVRENGGFCTLVAKYPSLITFDLKLLSAVIRAAPFKTAVWCLEIFCQEDQMYATIDTLTDVDVKLPEEPFSAWMLMTRLRKDSVAVCYDVGEWSPLPFIDAYTMKVIARVLSDGEVVEAFIAPYGWLCAYHTLMRVLFPSVGIFRCDEGLLRRITSDAAWLMLFKDGFDHVLNYDVLMATLSMDELIHVLRKEYTPTTH